MRVQVRGVYAHIECSIESNELAEAGEVDPVRFRLFEDNSDLMTTYMDYSSCMKGRVCGSGAFVTLVECSSDVTRLWSR